MRIAMLVALMLAALPCAAQNQPPTLRGLVAQAKASGTGEVVVMRASGETEKGWLTDIDGDVFCVAEDVPLVKEHLESCYPYAAIWKIRKMAPDERGKIVPVINIDGGKDWGDRGR